VQVVVIKRSVQWKKKKKRSSDKVLIFGK
jgi:hypothetical protein